MLLFSDGQDNASHSSLRDVIEACQHTNTAIYAFQMKKDAAFFSSGPGTMAELARETGGRVFEGDDQQISTYLRVIDEDLRDRYRLVYEPAVLKLDGSFHRIEMTASERVGSISVRSGYYAPTR